VRPSRESLLATPVSRAFDEIASRYDSQWTDSAIGQLQRKASWRLLDRVFQPGHHVLDLGCGTGVDAVYLTRRGMTVHAIDVAPAMIAIARRRSEEASLCGRLRTQVLGIEDLDFLPGEQVYDGVVSNFSPLNCVADLEPVAAQLHRLVRPGGTLVFCLMTRFCLWETLWYPLRGELKKASRRWRSPQSEARAGSNETFPVYHQSTRDVEAAFAPAFRLIHREGLGIFVPPSDANPALGRFPKLLQAMARLDRVVAAWPGFRSLGDHRLLVFQRGA
jgi:ubiquinone/menaquinone biosynthesis C-methylase UbiE